MNTQVFRLQKSIVDNSFSERVKQTIFKALDREKNVDNSSVLEHKDEVNNLIQQLMGKEVSDLKISITTSNGKPLDINKRDMETEISGINQLPNSIGKKESIIDIIIDLFRRKEK